MPEVYYNVRTRTDPKQTQRSCSTQTPTSEEKFDLILFDLLLKVRKLSKKSDSKIWKVKTFLAVHGHRCAVIHFLAFLRYPYQVEIAWNRLVVLWLARLYLFAYLQTLIVSAKISSNENHCPSSSTSHFSRPFRCQIPSLRAFCKRHLNLKILSFGGVQVNDLVIQSSHL